MRISLITVGKRMPDWVDSGSKEYLKRFPPELPVHISDINPAKRSKTTSKDKILTEEAQRIRAAVGKDDYVIALDERGKQLDTKKLAARMKDWLQDGRNIAFIIGGADGLKPDIIHSAHETWALSGFTMPHALVRVFLLEQLYRAWSILNNHPYHRE